MSCIFHSCKLVLHFHAPQFPPVQTGAANSCLSIFSRPGQSVVVYVLTNINYWQCYQFTTKRQAYSTKMNMLNSKILKTATEGLQQSTKYACSSKHKDNKITRWFPYFPDTGRPVNARNIMHMPSTAVYPIRFPHLSHVLPGVLNVSRGNRKTFAQSQNNISNLTTGCKVC